MEAANISARTLHVTLPEDVAQEIEQAVRDGEYGSSDEILREAAERWTMERWTESVEGVAYLKQAVREGLASGESEPWDVEHFLVRARQRHFAAPGRE